MLPLQAAWDTHACVGAEVVGRDVMGARVVGDGVTGADVVGAGVTGGLVTGAAVGAVVAGAAVRPQLGSVRNELKLACITPNRTAATVSRLGVQHNSVTRRPKNNN